MNAPSRFDPDRIGDFGSTTLAGGYADEGILLSRHANRMGVKLTEILDSAAENAAQLSAEAEARATAMIGEARRQAAETLDVAEREAQRLREQASAEAAESKHAVQAEIRQLIEAARRDREQIEVQVAALAGERDQALAELDSIARRVDSTVEQCGPGGGKNSP